MHTFYILSPNLTFKSVKISVSKVSIFLTNCFGCHKEEKKSYSESFYVHLNKWWVELLGMYIKSLLSIQRYMKRYL